MSYLLAITLLLAPTYALRFALFGFPANLLMVWILFVWAAFVADLSLKKGWRGFIGFIKSMDKKILVLSGLFFLAGLISLFIKSFDRQKLGQFIVLFLQPISLFFITSFTINRQSRTKSLLLATCYLLLVTMGLYAIIQYFTLLGVPPAWWGNGEEPRRALGFFGHPNFYALFSAPLLAFLLPDLGLKIKDLTKNWLFTAAWIIGAIGLMFSMSRAGWLGLAAAVAIYVLLATDKKIRRLILSAAIIIAMIILVVPNLRWRLMLPFYGEKSAVSRLSLWNTGLKGVKEAPITGLGLAGFAREWPTLNTDPGLAADSHNFPHNIFLDLWVETGMLGLISLAGLIGLLIYRGLRSLKSDVNGQSLIDNCFKLSVALFLIAMVFQGLIDNPYFKNDLAMIFWMILSFAV